MKRLDPKAAEYLEGALRDWLRGAPAGACKTDVAEAVMQNRLEPLMAQVVAGDECPREWGESYQRCLLHGLKHLQAGCGVMAVLERAGVPVLATRGPFFGAGLYGDVGLRHFTDIDLMVPVKWRDRALEAVRQEGFDFRHPEIPLWFYRRHHLHWPLVRAADGVLCDLHWAVDHPYKRQRIDYDVIFREASERSCEGFTWKEPCPRHQLLLAVAHLAKEVREFESGVPSAEELVATGRLLCWLDIAFIIRRAGASLDWPLVRREAAAWGLERALPLALVPAVRDFGAEVPREIMDELRVPAGAKKTQRLAWPAWTRRIAATAGFRVERVADAWIYLWSPRRDFDDGSTWWSRMGRLLLAGVDALACGVVVAFRRLWLMGLLLLAAPYARAETADAAPVTVNGSAVGGSIAYDVEKDWFAFSALPYAGYTITVTTGTIWDCALELRTPDGVSVLAETTTVFGASGGSMIWTNVAGHRLLYVRVGGFAEFTTGSYQVAVSGGGFPDSNGNRMPDAWEMQEFGNMTNTATGDTDGDGFSNEDEYLSGTQATNAASLLRIETLARTLEDVAVEWQAVPYGRYRVLTATNLVGGVGWTVLGTNLNVDMGTISIFTNAGGASLDRGFYRVEFVY